MHPDILARLFCEAFLSRTLWQFTSEIRYFAMLEFGEVDMLLPTIAAIFGGTAAGYVNSLLGMMLAHCQEKGLFVLSPEKYEKWQKRGECLVWILGLFSWYSVVSALIFGVGFLRVRSWKIILSVFIGQTLFFGYYYSRTV
jgi:membrane protein YqaA with SNARE-associated domain